MRRVRGQIKGTVLRRWFTVGGVPSFATPQGLQIFALRDSSETIETIANAYVNMDMATIRRFHELILNCMPRPPGTTPPQYEEALLHGIKRVGGGGAATTPIKNSVQAKATVTENVAAAKKAPEKNAFDVAIKKYPAANKVKLIKELRGVSGLTLQEAKAAVEKCPGVVVKAMACVDAEKLKALFEEHGAEVELI